MCVQQIKTQLKNTNFLKEAEQGLGIYLSGRVLAEQAQDSGFYHQLWKKKKREQKHLQRIHVPQSSTYSSKKT